VRKFFFTFPVCTVHSNEKKKSSRQIFSGHIASVLGAAAVYASREKNRCRTHSEYARSRGSASSKRKQGRETVMDDEYGGGGGASREDYVIPSSRSELLRSNTFESRHLPHNTDDRGEKRARTSEDDVTQDGRQSVPKRAKAASETSPFCLSPPSFASARFASNKIERDIRSEPGAKGRFKLAASIDAVDLTGDVPLAGTQVTCEVGHQYLPWVTRLLPRPLGRDTVGTVEECPWCKRVVRSTKAACVSGRIVSYTVGQTLGGRPRLEFTVECNVKRHQWVGTHDTIVATHVCPICTQEATDKSHPSMPPVSSTAYSSSSLHPTARIYRAARLDTTRYPTGNDSGGNGGQGGAGAEAGGTQKKDEKAKPHLRPTDTDKLRASIRARKSKSQVPRPPPPSSSTSASSSATPTSKKKKGVGVHSRLPFKRNPSGSGRGGAPTPSSFPLPFSVPLQSGTFNPFSFQLSRIFPKHLPLPHAHLTLCPRFSARPVRFRTRTLNARQFSLSLSLSLPNTHTHLALIALFFPRLTDVCVRLGTVVSLSHRVCLCACPSERN
jgi:hypothetical protein